MKKELASDTTFKKEMPNAVKDVYNTNKSIGQSRLFSTYLILFSLFICYFFVGIFDCIQLKWIVSTHKITNFRINEKKKNLYSVAQYYSVNSILVFLLISSTKRLCIHLLF